MTDGDLGPCAHDVAGSQRGMNGEKKMKEKRPEGGGVGEGGRKGGETAIQR